MMKNEAGKYYSLKNNMIYLRDKMDPISENTNVTD